MYSLLTEGWKKAKRTYHKVMLTYNGILYRDCLDKELKQRFYGKIMHHEQKLRSKTGILARR